MKLRRIVALVLVLFAVVLPGPAPVMTPPAADAQGMDVFLNVTGGGTKKLNIAIPEFTVVAGADTAGNGKQLASVTGADLTFSGLFSVVAATGTIPANNAEALRRSWTDFAAAGAHAGLHGLLALRGDRAEVEMRLYDLTNPEYPAHRHARSSSSRSRRPGGWPTRSPTRSSCSSPASGASPTPRSPTPADARGAKEVVMADYDGAGAASVTRNGSINLSPIWSPDARSLAFTSYKQGYPDLYRAFPFERRPEQTLAAFRRHQHLAGVQPRRAEPRPDAVARTATRRSTSSTSRPARFRRLTRHAGIDTEPTWSPTGRELAFVSDRARRHARVRDGSPGHQRAPAHHQRLSHPAALVAEGRHDRLHAAHRRLTRSGSWTPTARMRGV